MLLTGRVDTRWIMFSILLVGPLPPPPVFTAPDEGAPVLTFCLFALEILTIAIDTLACVWVYLRKGEAVPCSSQVDPLVVNLQLRECCEYPVYFLLYNLIPPALTLFGLKSYPLLFNRRTKRSIFFFF